MIVWAIISTLLFLITLITFALYRRQVKNTCRRLEFMRTHKTNMRLTSDLPFSDMNGLIDEINCYADNTRRLQSEVLEGEQSLK